MMNQYRSAVLAAAACAAAISLAACDGTVTTTSVVSSESTATTLRLPASASGTSGASSMVSVRNFPVPPGAQLISNGNANGSYDIIFDSVSPSEISRFYASALPQAGYTIVNDSSGNRDSFSGSGIWFTGHGYSGQIGAFSGGDVLGFSVGGNFAEVTLTPQ